MRLKSLHKSNLAPPSPSQGQSAKIFAAVDLGTPQSLGPQSLGPPKLGALKSGTPQLGLLGAAFGPPPQGQDISAKVEGCWGRFLA
jgi:hypothetical protein